MIEIKMRCDVVMDYGTGHKAVRLIAMQDESIPQRNQAAHEHFGMLELSVSNSGEIAFAPGSKHRVRIENYDE